jgi:chromosome segregation ATPase
MKAELEREKDVLKNHFADFEQQQSAMRERERELNTQYKMLSRQMEEQYALQSSTAKIVEDYQDTIQNLNQVIGEERERYAKDLDSVQARADGYEEKVHEVQAQLDEAKDMLRGNRQEIEERDYAVADYVEKLKKTQRQLAQLRMETLEKRVGPNATKDGMGEMGQRFPHRRTTSRRGVSATYATTNDTKPPEFVFKDAEKGEALVIFKTGMI